tara:strand:- start:222 stop:503 length:282 start_codon:yes stop_codon:yes gene_type:complete
MVNKKLKLKTELTREEVQELLEVYRSMDAICTDFREMFDTSIAKVSKLEDMSITLKNMFDFRPPTDSEGDPNHWRPYVLPDDDRAWFHKKEDK